MNRTTGCTLDCPDTCSMIAEIGSDGELRVKGNGAHPVTQGFICPKGAGFPKTLKRPDRITRPLLRRSGRYEFVGWDEALDLCAAKVSELGSDPRQILHVKGHGYRGVLAGASTVLFQRLRASGLYGSVCDDAGIEACKLDFGSLNTNDPSDLASASRIVNWGKDFSRSSLHAAALIRQARKKGARVLTITPSGEGVRDFSDQLILIRPGTDRFLAAAVILLLRKRGRVSESALDRAANRADFEALVEGYGYERLLEACDVSPAEAERLADWYEGPEPTATIMGWALQRYLYGGENVRYINALALISGNVGRSGGGAYYNISSGRNFSSWDDRPGDYSRRLLIPALGREILEADPPVRMIWVDGFNAVNQVPDCRSVARAFEKVEFVVAVEAFMNDTALRADLVLPPALMLERDEIVGSAWHNYVNFSARVVDPPGQALDDFEIISRLGRLLDPPLILPDREECFRRALASPRLGLDPEEFKKTGFARADWPRVAYEGPVFDHPDGKYRFPETLSPEPPQDPEHPLRLLTLVNRNYIHSQIPEEDQAGPPSVFVSPDNEFYVRLGRPKRARLCSPLGGLEVKLEAVEDLHPEAVVIRRGGWMRCGRGANFLIAPLTADLGFQTAYYSQGVRLDPGQV